MPPCFGHANTFTGPAGSSITPQLFPGWESPNWFAHTDTVMSSPACNWAVPWFHVKVNVLDRATLEAATEHPERFPDLTVRVGGYATNLTQLTPEQQRDVISRDVGSAP